MSDEKETETKRQRYRYYLYYKKDIYQKDLM